MLTEYRRIRSMQAREGLPAILWTVLIVGGVITVSAACFFGVPSFRFHVLQVAVLSFLISLVLVAVEDIDRPYQGGVTVQPEGFSFSRETITMRQGH
jgi:ABC-type branched-subunit amino acid transport system permease subunit